MRNLLIFLIVVLVLALIVACVVMGYLFLNQKFVVSSPPQLSIPTKEVALPTILPTYTVQPTYTALPTYTVEPTAYPTYTLLPTYTVQPTYTALPTYTPQPTVLVGAKFTPNQPVFCREGPSSKVWWNEEEALNEGQTVTIIGKSSSVWGLWWFVQKASGVKCWVFSDLGSATGNVNEVPELMTPATPTASFLTVTLKNNHGAPLCQVYATSNWTKKTIEILQGKQLLPGQKIKFYLSAGYYNFDIIQCPSILVDIITNVSIKVNTALTTP